MMLAAYKCVVLPGPWDARHGMPTPSPLETHIEDALKPFDDLQVPGMDHIKTYQNIKTSDAGQAILSRAVHHMSLCSMLLALQAQACDTVGGIFVAVLCVLSLAARPALLRGYIEEVSRPLAESDHPESLTPPCRSPSPSTASSGK